MLNACVFIDAPTARERVWAIDLAARCAGVCLVIGDGSAVAMPESRRLQLAAARTPVLLARPGWEQREPSAARTRWRVSPLAPPTEIDTHDRRRGWAVELLRCKGVQPGEMEAARHRSMRWAVRWDYATGQVEHEWTERTPGDGDLAAGAGDRPDRAARSRPA